MESGEGVVVFDEGVVASVEVSVAVELSGDLAEKTISEL